MLIRSRQKSIEKTSLPLSLIVNCSGVLVVSVNIGGITLMPFFMRLIHWGEKERLWWGSSKPFYSCKNTA